MTTAQELYQKIGFGTRTGFGDRPALILIDLFNGCTNPDSPIGFDQSEEISHTQKLLEVARGKGVPVVFVTVARIEAELKHDMNVKKIPARKTQIDGTWATEIDERLKPQPLEPIIKKKAPSGFFGTNLHSLLTGMRVDTTILVGNSTSGCVRATATDSISCGFRTVLPRECVADRDPEVHKKNLFDIGAKYADVVPVEEVLTYFKNLAPQSG